MKRFTALFLSLWLALAQVAWATSITTTGAGGSATSPPEAFSLTYVTNSSVGTSFTTYDFGTLSLGTDVGGSNVRYTVITPGGVSSGTGVTRQISSVSIAGVGGTLVIRAAAIECPSGIYLADTTGLGTTGNISVTFSGAMNAANVGVYRMVNPASSTATDSATTSSTTALTLDNNISAGGAGLGYACIRDNGVNSHAWTGLTENFDVDFSSNDYGSAASGGSAGTPTAIDDTFGDVAQQASGVVASWAP